MPIFISLISIQCLYYDRKNFLINRHHIIHAHFTRCLTHVPVEILQKFAILTILQRFQNKSNEKMIFLLFCLKWTSNTPKDVEF